MTKSFACWFAVVFASLIGSEVFAGTIGLPSSVVCGPNGGSGPRVMGTAQIGGPRQRWNDCPTAAALGPLSLLYRVNRSGIEAGFYRDSYTTLFGESSANPGGALLTYVGGNAMPCAFCFLIISSRQRGPSGDALPVLSFAGIAEWSGLDSLNVRGVGPRWGPSYFAIWGHDPTQTAIPEPGTLALIGVGLVGVVVRKRFRGRT